MGIRAGTRESTGNAGTRPESKQTASCPGGELTSVSSPLDAFQVSKISPSPFPETALKINPFPPVGGGGGLKISGEARSKSREALSCQYNVKSVTSEEKFHGEPPENGGKGHNACYKKLWTITTWAREDPLKRQFQRYQCRSWKHGGPCREFRGRQDFARIKKALDSREGWVYMVFTYPQKGRNRDDTYRSITPNLQSFIRWLTRTYGKIDYISLIEQHRTGFPHINVLVHNPGLVAETEANYKKPRKLCKAAAVRNHFGKIFWLEPMRNKEAAAGYFVKLCHEADTAAGEVAKTNQAPVCAPPRFRRLRASKGLLPPARIKDPERTGQLDQAKTKSLEAVEILVDFQRLSMTENERKEELTKALKFQQKRDTWSSLTPEEKRSMQGNLEARRLEKAKQAERARHARLVNPLVMSLYREFNCKIIA